MPVSCVYVSYDGALDPLGASQAVSYVLGLTTRGVRFVLISFEKPERWRDVKARAAMQKRLDAAGVRWRPLRYHKAPRLPATLWDILRGAAAVRREVARSGATLVHCRGDVAMAMARWARLSARTRLLYDVRGFFSDERTESGSWRRGSMVDRAVQAVERANLRRADGLVVLTRAALAVLSSRYSRLPPHRIIPTCVDLSAFTPAPVQEPREFALAYVGSLGTWYMTREMVDFARTAGRVLGGRVLFLTPDVDAAQRAGAVGDWVETRMSPPADVPGWLRRTRAVFFFIRATPAKKASCPTKLGEALASGVPVVTNVGIGDVDELIESEGVGVLVDRFTDESYRGAAEALGRLMGDPDTSRRCRQAAENRLGLDTALAAYRDLYAELGGEEARPRLTAASP